MPTPAITALAVEFPAGVRTNSCWLDTAGGDTRSETEAAPFVRLLASAESAPPDRIFDEERAPYLADPFRGARERRVLAEGEGTLDLETRAVRALLAARGASPADVDAWMVSSFVADTLGAQNAAYLTRRLGVSAPAWNYESTCTSSVVGLQTASALVRSGEYERVAVVVSIGSSRLLGPGDSLARFLGDGAAAFLVEPAADEGGVLASSVIGTPESCDAFRCELARDERDGRPVVRWRVGDPEAGRSMRDNAGDQLRRCVGEALRKAGHGIDEVDFFVFNTPVAWFAAFAARSLGVSQDRTMSVYERYANIGAVLTPACLFHAAREGRVRRGDLVVLFAVGSVSTAGAIVLRWGDTALGPEPAPGVPLTGARS
ncbi:3-oxoacyl-ACP synthase III family protein [Streptomyces sp. NPDC005805]|uniref:3-oxoacyl-ACP synthase III family protein n=1 Tax=Streptomyces sp. NPDC005805 TaxID=3157068 RepID=UPI0033F5FA35